MKTRSSSSASRRSSGCRTARAPWRSSGPVRRNAPNSRTEPLMEVGDDLHLTYCTNIHPAVGWAAVLESLRAHAPALKARLSPDAPFGIGLRLSGAESSELLAGTHLDD